MLLELNINALKSEVRQDNPEIGPTKASQKELMFVRAELS